ncbi:22162_t:CDS:2 [Rhizophagus irregularis]|nr:22162_t:CDS:2 [Rhizophagus irregularis]
MEVCDQKGVVFTGKDASDMSSIQTRWMSNYHWKKLDKMFQD